MDSGIGGISIMRETVKLLPNEQYYYYADVDNVPYGLKSDDEILTLTDKAVNFLSAKGCDLVCIACNTATSVAAETLRNKYDFPIVGVEPAVKPAVREHDGSSKRILVLATPVTVKRKRLHDLIARFDSEHLVDLKGLGKLPEFAEHGIFGGAELQAYLDSEFADIDTSAYSEIVLGCTHFIYFKEILSDYFLKNTVFLDGNEGTARHLYCIATEKQYKHYDEFGVSYFDSGRPVIKQDRLDFLNRFLIEK